jgi:hypothetical protein
MKRTMNLLVTFALLLLLAACEGGGGGGGSSSVTTEPSGSPEPAAATLSGTVADGYLSGARVFLDRNGNRSYDSGEPMAISAAGGAFSLSINPAEGGKYSVVVEVIGGQTIDEDHPQQPVADSYLLEAPVGRWQFVSPLTTLVNLEMQKNPTITLQRAELKVKGKIGIADDISLFEDYLAPVPGKEAEAQRTHKAAQVVASLMGTLRREIANNLGDQTVQEQLIAYLVSDEIMRHGAYIAEALDAERNLNQEANVPALKMAISGRVDTAGLNLSKLQRYAARIAEKNNEVWDMEPPSIKQQTIADGAIVSVATPVTVIFDKEINPATLSANAISLRRAGSHISGVVDYDAELKRLSFNPNQMLFPDSNYQIIVSGQLADHLGNQIGKDQTWQFSTLFDLTPPPLAEIGPEQ